MIVANSAGVETTVYPTYAEALHAVVREPLAEFEDDFDVDAIAGEVIEWHTEYIERDGKTFEWLPLNGYCSALSDDPDDFWRLVCRHEITSNEQ